MQQDTKSSLTFLGGSYFMRTFLSNAHSLLTKPREATFAFLAVCSFGLFPTAQAEPGLEGFTNYVSCTLNNGQELVANEYMVIVGDEILAKREPYRRNTRMGIVYRYEDWEYVAIVYKRRCSQGGQTGINYLHKESGKWKHFVCQEQDHCQ